MNVYFNHTHRECIVFNEFSTLAPAKKFKNFPTTANNFNEATKF